MGLQKLMGALIINKHIFELERKIRILFNSLVEIYKEKYSTSNCRNKAKPNHSSIVHLENSVFVPIMWVCKLSNMQE